MKESNPFDHWHTLLYKVEIKTEFYSKIVNINNFPIVHYFPYIISFEISIPRNINLLLLIDCPFLNDFWWQLETKGDIHDSCLLVITPVFAKSPYPRCR